MNALGEFIVCKEAVIAINKNTYISNWFYYRMLELSSADHEGMMSYLNWVAKMMALEQIGELPKDARDFSFYITRILNVVMADLTLSEKRKREKHFRMTDEMTKEQRKDMCDLIALLFEIAAKNKDIANNLAEFTRRNKFDFYYRFMIYLGREQLYGALNTMGIALCSILEGCRYALPDMYRLLSLAYLAEETMNPEYMVTVTLCRVNKYFFYTSEQKRLFAELLEKALIEKVSLHSTSLKARLEIIDCYLLKVASKIPGFLFDAELIKEEPSEEFEEEEELSQSGVEQSDEQEGHNPEDEDENEDPQNQNDENEEEDLKPTGKQTIGNHSPQAPQPKKKNKAAPNEKKKPMKKGRKKERSVSGEEELSSYEEVHVGAEPRGQDSEDEENEEEEDNEDEDEDEDEAKSKWTSNKTGKTIKTNKNSIGRSGGEESMKKSGQEESKKKDGSRREAEVEENWPGDLEEEDLDMEVVLAEIFPIDEYLNGAQEVATFGYQRIII